MGSPKHSLYRARLGMNSYSYGDANQPPKPPKPGESDERMWAMFCHLSTLSGCFFPMGSILGPLVVWLIKKDEYALVDDQGKEALNFQISVMIWALIAGLLCIVLIGIPLIIALVVFDFVVTIMAAIQANQGNCYRYPMTIRFVQ